MKRAIKLALVLIALLAAAGTGTYFYIGRVGASDLEAWIGRQVVGIIEHQITPKVTFASLDYQAPFTVVIEKLTLTAQDKPIIAIDRALLELAELPQYGQPIQIKTIELDAPHILLAQRPAEAGGGLIGWSGFVRTRQEREQAPTGQRLSDVLRLRHVAIRNGQIVYDAGDGTPPMTLPGIELNLDTPPRSAGQGRGEAVATRPADAPGAYRLAGTLQRAPVMKLTFDGWIDLDDGVLGMDQLQLTSDIGEEQYGTLPPALQEMLRRHEVKGRLVATLSGQMPLADPTRADVKLRAELTQARVSLGQTVWPVERLLLTAGAKDGQADAQLEAAALRGQIRLAARATLADQWPAGLTWELSDLRIEDALRIIEGGQPRYAGRLGGKGQVQAQLAAVPGSLSGTGRLQVREGHLLYLTIIRHLALATSKNPQSAKPTRRDAADVQFEVRGDRIEITEGTVDTPLIRLRGKGPIFYDQRLDLNVRVGVLENVAGAFGEIGSLVGRVTEQAVQYQVTHTLAEPKVEIRPLGLGK